MKELYSYKANQDDELNFNPDGTIDVCAYSYTIDSYGEFELNKKETKKLYEAMKKYYETNEN